MIYLFSLLVIIFNVYSIIFEPEIYVVAKVWFNILNSGFLIILITTIGVHKRVTIFHTIVYGIIIILQLFFVIYPQFLLSTKLVKKCSNSVIYSQRDNFTGKTWVFQDKVGQIGSISNNGIDGDIIYIYNIYATQDLLDCLKDKEIRIEYVE